MYVKFFDVKLNYKQKVVPVSIIDVKENRFDKEIIPAFYITNDAVKKLSKKELSKLAANIAVLIKKISKKISVNPINEIQVDCDWTIGSKEKYFYFLKEFRKKSGVEELSATLRLWQYKLPKKAGIPPVDRCMLMCYSTGNPQDYNTKNAIADSQVILSYLKKTDYELPVDIALPIYFWAIHFRNKEFVNIFQDFDFRLFKDNNLFASLPDNKYLLKKDTVLHNTYLRAGDEIKVNEISINELNRIATIASKQKTAQKRIAVFSWENKYLKKYKEDEIKTIFSKFD